ncbi:MAG: flap endonuclease-1 [Candidatus Diapherotrites archaeon]|uniref:Flap endonuclease 1 n=1 Tax=Candidatus Iainarchaeum sp. TaxID=3101447 RepID=A0A7K4BYV0_9ARCH|nr:flap endonuclease-1 [Candidatus Diapherotrites archaeon]
MGVNLSDIIEKKEITLQDLGGKKVGIDSYNMLYQFLASIRGQDGLPLADSQGQVTSHLTGLFYRTLNLMDVGIKPIYVFDGVPSELKKETLKKRTEIRTDAMEKSASALKEGNFEEAQKFGSRALKLTPLMVSEAKELLSYMGVPVVQAQEEGEAQASVMCNQKLIDGVVSQDFDCLLFGANDLYRNVGFSGKRKVPGKNFFVEIKPEHLNSMEILSQLKIDRKKLIWLGILVGTDFNKKFPRVGPKTALKLVQKFDDFDDIIKETKYEPDFDYKKIENVFLNPVSFNISEKDIQPKEMDKDKIIEFLVERHDFSRERVEKTLNTYLDKKSEKEKQKNLGAWFG